MVLKLEDRYPGRTGVASTDYPDGSFRDESTTGMNNGTPLQVDWANDREGFRQGMVRTVGSTPNGVVDTAVQSQALEAALSNALGHTRPRGMSPESVCSGLQIADNAAFPNLSPNRSGYLTSLAAVSDLCVAWDHTKDRPVLILADSTDLLPIECWDYSSSPSLGTALSVSISPTLYHSVACDGTAIYAAYDAGGNTFIAKFLLGTPSVAWTGTAVWDIDTGVNSSVSDMMIIADDDNLAILLDGATATTWTIGIIAKSDGAITTGKGNDSGYSTNPRSLRITSNGDHVFVPMESGSNSYLLSAKISSPSTSDYSAKFVTTGDVFTDVVALNSDTIAVCSLATASLESDIRVFHLADDEFAAVGNLVSPVSNQSGDEFVPRMCFDGLNINMTHAVIGTTGSSKTVAVRRINGTRFSPNMDFGTIAAPVTALGCTNVSGSSGPSYEFVFDGRDLWVCYPDETADYSLFRIQAPGIRGV